ncbi:MAG: dNDP-4-keto-6-deoxy-glucose-2,3- dehydratase [Nitrosomonas sp.]|jgi:dTDP-4-dehydro-6-deoxy-alpha-D-glucopyranose 2,3-dehydratase|nr:MAG: dNDP-4-keto-6-deoxy-glucose-2,3- dehydratase [Nitrosomonas sp.]
MEPIDYSGIPRNLPTQAWLEAHRRDCDMQVEEIPWNASKEWSFDGHGLRHRTGGFFAVVGIRAYIDEVAQYQLDQPLIDQPEIGILGFIIRGQGDEAEILLHAKAEPGNIGLVQVGPSVQATESNYKRRHEGKKTPYLAYFLNFKESSLVSDSLQSEQGTRFLGKYNRNMIVQVDDSFDFTDTEVHQWFLLKDFLPILLQDFQINTDARSVLVSSRWSALTSNEKPFSRYFGKGGLGEALYHSYNTPNDQSIFADDEIMPRLEKSRIAADFTTQLIGLSELKNWVHTDDRMSATEGNAFEVRQFRVKSSEREVTKWDQPLVASDEEGSVILLAQEKDGVLYFLFNSRAEIGFRERCQWGPTIQNLAQEPFIFSDLADSEIELKKVMNGSKQLLSQRHSDEGGRFYRCVSTYSLHLLNEDVEVALTDNLVWMNMRQIELFTPQKGFFTNEARSLLSMLLAYL